MQHSARRFAGFAALNTTFDTEGRRNSEKWDHPAAFKAKGALAAEAFGASPDAPQAAHAAVPAPAVEAPLPPGVGPALQECLAKRGTAESGLPGFIDSLGCVEGNGEFDGIAYIAGVSVSHIVVAS